MRQLLIAVLIIYSVILFRASHQAVTIDEADSFNNFANEHIFYPSSGNHVLNSLLARESTRLFGSSQFTFRIPSMIGAAFYLLASAAIAGRLAPNHQALRLLGFAILTLNPFILDYLIASRGYFLALGFLASAVILAFRVIDGKLAPGRAIGESICISLCLALSFVANFSFAFTVIATLGAFLLTLLLTKTPARQWIAIVAASTLPGAAFAYVLVGQTLRAFPRSQLYYGAQSWNEMWTEMLNACYPRENLSVQAIHLEPVLTAARLAAPYLLPILIAAALWAGFTVKDWPTRFVWLALGFTLAAHGLAHAFQGLLLPLDRTSLFILFFLSVLAIHGAVSAPSPFARRAATAVLCASVVVFVLSFRTNYFRIWYWDMDTDRGFNAVAEYTRTHSLKSAGCSFRYAGAYNFYRKAAGSERVPACDFINEDNPEPRDVYFVISPFQDEFIARAKLRVIYQGPVTGMVVGVAPRE